MWDSWSPPRNCGSDCSISVQYHAPALTCRNLQQDELMVRPYSGGNWTFYSYKGLTFPESREAFYPTFSFSYVPSISGTPDNRTLTMQQTGDIRGVECNFFDGMYAANLSVTSGVKHASIAATVRNDSVENCSLDNGHSEYPFCASYQVSAINLINIFSKTFNISLQWMYINETLRHISTLPVVTTRLFNVTISHQPVPDSPNRNYTLLSMEMNSTDLSRDIMELFNGVLLTSLLLTNETETGPALILDHQTTWVYEPRVLWLVYGISILLFLTFVFYGLYRGLIQGVAMINRFSTVLLRTRRKELRDICDLPPTARMREHLLDTTCDQFVRHKQSPSAPDALDTPNVPTDSIEQQTIENYTPIRSRELAQNRWAKATILSALAAAVVLSGIHYIFLSKINGQNIKYYSQFWMRNTSNGLAQAVVLCLGVVATTSLTQATWRSVRIRSVRIVTIDDLFALPNPEAIFSLFRGLMGHWQLLPTFIAMTIYIATLVSILAPNALTIGLSNERPVQFKIPQIDYSKFGQPDDTIDGNTPVQMDAVNLSPELLWDAPSNCGPVCAFEFEYEAPALSCVEIDMRMSDMIVDDEIFFLRGDWENEFSPNQWDTSSTYSFSTSYMQGVARITKGSAPVFNLTTQPKRTICQCQDGLYKASFKFSNGQKSRSLRLLSYNNSFTKSCPWGNMSSVDTACQQYAIASTFACDIYGNRTMGTSIKFVDQNGSWIGMGNLRRTGAALWRLFKHRTTVRGTDRNFSLSLNVPNLSEAHVQLFSDLTLGLIPDTNRTTVVNGTTWGESVWKFNKQTLWSVYGIAHASMLLIALYGLYCIRDNEAAIENTFSNIMLATRTKELDNACVAMPNHKALLQLKLRYDKEGHFLIEDNSSRHQNDEERPVETLPLATHSVVTLGPMNSQRRNLAEGP